MPGVSAETYSFMDGSGVDYLADNLGEFSDLMDKVDVIRGSFTLEGNSFSIEVEMADKPLVGAEASSYASNASGLLMRILMMFRMDGPGGEAVDLSVRTLYTYSEAPSGDGYVFTTFYWELLVDYYRVDEGYGNYSVMGNTMIFAGEATNTSILDGSTPNLLNVTALFNWQGIYLAVDYAGEGWEAPDTAPVDTPVVDPDTTPGVVDDTDQGVPSDTDDAVEDSQEKGGEEKTGVETGDTGMWILIGLVAVGIVGAGVALYILRSGGLSK